ncbi:hypothetical protein C4588_02695 [Candidatus Parcubacteria bacterium]|nr:MAG: hypothetical protein C4588_02695 [Candidatus Parcubacteria bacterium]
MLEPGQTLEVRYKVVKIIEKDDLTAVYLGKHINLKKPIIIKEINGTSLVPATRQMVTPIFTQKSREYAKLQHPSITNIIDFFPMEESFYLVYEHIEGKTFKASMGERGSLPYSEKEVIEYGIQICKPLWFLHNQKPNPILLGNLNPRNIIIKSEEEIMLLNSNLKRYILGSSSGCKPGYTAPECYRSQFIPESDIFSLGSILYYLASGLDPGGGHHTDYGLPSLKTLNSQISPELERIIKKATATDVKERFRTVKEMKDSLLECLKMENKPVKEENKNEEQIIPEIREYRPDQYKGQMQQALETCLTKEETIKISRITKTLIEEKVDPDEPLFELSRNLDEDPFEKIARRRARAKEKELKKQKARYTAAQRIQKAQVRKERKILFKFLIPIIVIILILIGLIIYFGTHL